MKRIDGLETSFKRVDENVSVNVKRLEAIEGVTSRVDDLEANNTRLDALESSIRKLDGLERDLRSVDEFSRKNVERIDDLVDSSTLPPHLRMVYNDFKERNEVSKREKKTN